jgi:pimeloyl-ACP methyl ester carboxylesterase
MFEYFPDNYSWSLANMIALNCSGNISISELDDACRPLKEVAKRNDDAAQEETVEEALQVAKKMTLDGVADKITCPLLVMHGENDRQVPLSYAEKTIEKAVNSPGRKLKVFTLAEGGAEHCQVDNGSLAIDYAADWIAETLGACPKGV